MNAVLFLSEFYQLGLVLALLATSVAGKEEDRDPAWLPFVAWLGVAVAFDVHGVEDWVGVEIDGEVDGGGGPAEVGEAEV